MGVRNLTDTDHMPCGDANSDANAYTDTHSYPHTLREVRRG